jgi:hypothetical protein
MEQDMWDLYKDYGFEPCSFLYYSIKHIYTVSAYTVLILIGIFLSFLLKLLFRNIKFFKRLNLVFFYFLIFNFPFRYYLQSCLSLFIYSTQQIRLDKFSSFDIGGVSVSLVYLISFTIFYFLLMYFIIKKLKNPKEYPLKIIDIYSGMRKSRMRIFAFNFWFVALRFLISGIANGLTLVID